ncbi:MAG: hypothetical protein IKT46_02565 [Clostridia bacterium]|nr:hypothetical protein [Clostridia bacterium]
MYIYNPKRESKAHIVIPVLLLIIAAIAIASSGIGYIPPVAMQAIGFICASVAIYLIARYSLCDHSYEADPDNKVFNVRKRSGKKITLVAAIDYNHIIAVDKRDKEYSINKKYGKAFKVHNFCNNIFPTETYAIVCDVSGEDIALIIEADKTLLDILERR